MNAGAWGREIGELLRAVEVIDPQGNLREIPAAELRLSYRRLNLAAGETDRVIFLSATFSLVRDAEKTIRARRNEYLAHRKGKQPAGVASAGSFFKNPPGDAAGRLIEAAGCKGTCCGQAMVSPVHANFIVNAGQATATDILTLMEQVQEEVFRQFAVRLMPEVDIL
jgi:UDP-N-acetylmuramate dehydrogenase